MDEPSIHGLRGRNPGEDPDDPYSDINIEELPEWWRDAVLEHEQYGLRPYRPSIFSDGKLKYKVVEELETEYDIDIRFICSKPSQNDLWKIHIDGVPMGKIRHYRSTKGYSIFRMDSHDFERWVRSIVEAQNTQD